MIQWSGYRRRVVFLVILLALLCLPGAVSQAQGPGVDVLIYKVDTADFPTMQVYSSPRVEGQVLPDLTPEEFRIYENGTNKAIDDVRKERIGTQVAIVLDASGSFNLPGVTDPGKKRINEAVDAIDELILNKEAMWLDLDNRTDKLMLMAPTGSNSFEVMQDWTDAYTTIHNAAYPLQPVKGDTPLLKMLQEAMKRMKDLPEYRERAKFLLVFSDGIDRISAQDISDVLKRADSLGVTILSVKMGPANAGEGKNLQRLAEETNGAYIVYAGPESLAPLYSVIRSQAHQYILTYQSAIKTSGDHAVQVGVVQDGREYQSEPYSFPIFVKPPEVFIANPNSIQKDPKNPEPMDGMVIKRITNDWKMDLADIEPKSMPVRVIVRFPDEHPRDIVEVIYAVNGKVLAKLPPTQSFIWDFTKLPLGENDLTLVVRVRDVLGLEGESDPTRVKVIVSRPEPPTNSVIMGTAPGRKGNELLLLDDAGRTIASTTVAEDETFQFANLGEGTYTIKDVTATDGQNVIGPFQVDGTQQFQVPEDQTFPPPPIVEPPRDIWYWLLMALALFALGFSAFVYWKRPQAVMSGLSTVTAAVQEMTQPFRPRRGMQYQASASLVPILDDAGTRGKPIPLPAQSVFIGRDPARAQITFADPTVSRLHARIVEESDGVFLLYDEGSSSGTYVNEVPVTHEPVRLNAGDIIEFGRVRVIFVPEADAEVTEPFIPTR
ncbi:MAG TPA: FHA domain-containing protein [Anaerolineae bacterium]|nr:FHA domain-containing protein [Anaerolineae bacterium]